VGLLQQICAVIDFYHCDGALGIIVLYSNDKFVIRERSASLKFNVRI
jgi:hypothetical protein